VVKIDTPTLDSDFAIPSETQALKGTQDIVGGTWNSAWAIDILHAQQPLSAVVRASR
jgi:hypothetical protein